jgi:hypothetical protein
MPQIDGRLVAETLGQCRPGLAKPFTQQALHQAVEHAMGRATLDGQDPVCETREATRDLVAYARSLRGG